MQLKKFVASLTTGALLTGMVAVNVQPLQIFAAEDESLCAYEYSVW